MPAAKTKAEKQLKGDDFTNETLGIYQQKWRAPGQGEAQTKNAALRYAYTFVQFADYNF